MVQERNHQGHSRPIHGGSAMTALLADHRSIGETTTAGLAHKTVHAVRIGQLASRVPEVKLGQVTRKVLVRDVVESPINAALQLPKEVFDCVRGHVAADVLTEAVGHGVVTTE